MEVKKIVIITTGQPATNPRAVKEATALHSAGYDVHFIYSFWADWAVPFDREIIEKNSGIQWKLVGGDPFENRFLWAYSRVRHKLSRWLSKSMKSNLTLARNAASRTGFALIKAATGIKADLYIAHNLGALPAAAVASCKHRSPYAFDAEDFHRGQELPDSMEQKRATLLEDNYIPRTVYVSSASPLIADAYRHLYNKEPLVINNVFSKVFLASVIKKTELPIKLFWFSQTIGKGRGLEDIVRALGDMPKGSFTLTLLGSCSDFVKQYFIQLANIGTTKVEIIFQQPVSVEELFLLAAKHDVGLALEQPGELNRDLCLTNKIFTYLLAGNAIIFTDTSAQAAFFNAHPAIGALYRCGNIFDLQNTLKALLNVSSVHQMKQEAAKLAGEVFNWEAESGKLVNKIREVLKH